MVVKATGHAEIDQQHAILGSILEELAGLCTVVSNGAAKSCDGCSSQKQQECRAALTVSSSQLRSFLIGHSRYEEKLMELLPDTEKCRTHTADHKDAHQGIAKQLKRLSARIAKDSPQAVNALMLQLVGDWLGEHTAQLDTELIEHLSNDKSPEINFDTELVAILDKHVFYDRPTASMHSTVAGIALQRKKLEFRGSLEFLSPAQREVFWLIVCGKTNQEIADQLGNSVNTIKTHRAAIFRKLEVRSVLDLVIKTNLLRD